MSESTERSLTPPPPPPSAASAREIPAPVPGPAAAPRAEANPRATRRVRIGFWLLLLALVAGGALLAWRGQRRVETMAGEQRRTVNAGPVVQVSDVTIIPAGKSIELVGESRPYLEATLYAKVSGYLKTVNVNEGASVKRDQVLATISAPAVEQAYRAARADAVNKGRIARRYRALVRQELVSRQEAEEAFTASAMAAATLASATQDRDYTIVRAPFDGVVTSRLVDPGDLVANASNGKSEQQALLVVAETRRLKINAYVDQQFAPAVTPGLPVKIFLPERQDEKFDATIARVAGALDRRTRMLPVEVDFDNARGQIVAGSFVQVALDLPTTEAVSVPVEAILVREDKPMVAVAEPAGDRAAVARLRPVVIMSNDGSVVTLASGVKEGDRVILNGGDALRDGQRVRPVGGNSEKPKTNPEQK